MTLAIVFWNFYSRMGIIMAGIEALELEIVDEVRIINIAQNCINNISGQDFKNSPLCYRFRA
jgi:hypothetical protein